eukprot:gene13101-biopygen2667
MRLPGSVHRLARWADGLRGKSAGRLGRRQAGRPAGRLGGGGWPRYPIVGVQSPSPLSPVTESPVTVISRYRYLPLSPVTVISRYRYPRYRYLPPSPVTVISRYRYPRYRYPPVITAQSRGRLAGTLPPPTEVVKTIHKHSGMVIRRGDPPPGARGQHARRHQTQARTAVHGRTDARPPPQHGAQEKWEAICFLSEGRLGGVVSLGGSRLPPKTTELIWVTGREKGSA